MRGTRWRRVPRRVERRTVRGEDHTPRLEGERVLSRLMKFRVFWMKPVLPGPARGEGGVSSEMVGRDWDCSEVTSSSMN